MIREETGEGIGDLFSFERGTSCGIKKRLYWPIALILASLQMAELPHYILLIDRSIEQPEQEIYGDE